TWASVGGGGARTGGARGARRGPSRPSLMFGTHSTMGRRGTTVYYERDGAAATREASRRFVAGHSRQTRVARFPRRGGTARGRGRRRHRHRRPLSGRHHRSHHVPPRRPLLLPTP